jgi:hypothetical protein
MDKTLTVLLSGLGGGQFPMVVDLVGPTAEAFRHIAADNPLTTLNEPDRILLWSMLKLYDVLPIRNGKGQSDDDPLERLAKLANEAATFGTQLESEVFQGPYSDVIHPFTSSFSDLPGRLAEFSKLMGGMMDLFGKPGHKGRNLTNQLLIQASEFVRLKTGKHYDEHLAELFQAISERPLTRDLSGDAIRHKRTNLKKSYRILFSQTLERARRSSESTAARDSS